MTVSEGDSDSDRDDDVTCIGRPYYANKAKGVKYYTSLRQGGQVYSLNDTVLVKVYQTRATEKQSGSLYCPVQILHIWQDLDQDQSKRVTMEVRWYYFRDDLPAKRRPKAYLESEIFETNHVDAVPAGAITKKVTVSYSDYDERLGAKREMPPGQFICGKLFCVHAQHFMPVNDAPGAVAKRGNSYSKRKGQLPQKHQAHGARGVDDDALARSSFDNALEKLQGIADGQGGMLYISGIPGSGKTVTVMEVVSKLKVSAAEAQLPEFDFVSVNAMNLKAPSQLYQEIWKQLNNGISASASKSLKNLKWRFNTSSRLPCVLLLVDELDYLNTGNRSVMYNLLEWPMQKNNCVYVVGISNLMDLKERLTHKEKSRLGVKEVNFRPYTSDQVKEIVQSRLGETDVFEAPAIRLAASKVAAWSGDMRMALQICRRGLEIAAATGDEPQQRSAKRQKVQVSTDHIQSASRETRYSPLREAIRTAVPLEKLVVIAVVALCRKSGKQIVTFESLRDHVAKMCDVVNKGMLKQGQGLKKYDLPDLEDYETPKLEELLEVVKSLIFSTVLTMFKSKTSKTSPRHPTVMLSMSSADVAAALHQDAIARRFLPEELFTDTLDDITE